MKIKVYLQTVPYARETQMFITGEHADGRGFRCKPMMMEFEEWPEGEGMEPTLKFAGPECGEFLQGLASALSEVGYKVDSSHERGELKATKEHFSDMRKLVFKT